MATKYVRQWGRSLAVRITKEEAEELHWEHNTPIKVSVVDGKLVAEAITNTPRYALEELLEGLNPETAHAQLDNGLDNPVGNEVW